MLFFNKEKNKKSKSCPGSNLFVLGFFIVTITYFLLQYNGQIPENFTENFLNK